MLIVSTSKRFNSGTPRFYTVRFIDEGSLNSLIKTRSREQSFLLTFAASGEENTYLTIPSRSWASFWIVTPQGNLTTVCLRLQRSFTWLFISSIKGEITNPEDRGRFVSQDNKSTLWRALEQDRLAVSRRQTNEGVLARNNTSAWAHPTKKMTIATTTSASFLEHGQRHCT